MVNFPSWGSVLTHYKAYFINISMEKFLSCEEFLSNCGNFCVSEKYRYLAKIREYAFGSPS